MRVEELWRFIGGTREVWWVWVALGSRTRQAVAMVAGDWDEFTARCWWEALPPEHQEGAIVATDLLPVYQTIVPERWHATGEKGSGLTNHMERSFTFRQRCARFVRKTLSFARKVENHVGALWHLIRQYNLCHT